MYQEEVICQKCQNTRKVNLKIPCESCGARSTLFGYLYLDEYRVFLRATIVILLFVVLAVIASVIFLVYQRLLISEVSFHQLNLSLAARLIHPMLTGGQA
jgi:hypothetical protein